MTILTLKQYPSGNVLANFTAPTTFNEALGPM